MIYKLTIYQKRDAAKQKTSIIYITSHKSLSAFAVSMSKFLTGFDCSCGFVVEMLWKCLISSKISLSNSRSNMKVRVGQFTFSQSDILSKLKKWTEIRISTVDPLRILEKFSYLFSGQKVGHQLTLQMVIIKYHIYMVLFYIYNE